MNRFLYISVFILLVSFTGYAQYGSVIPDLEKLQKYLETITAEHTERQKPLIGISASIQNNGSYIKETYIQSVLKAGGIPVIIPAIDDEYALQEILLSLDGLMLTGGADINPLWYNEEPLRQLQSVDPVRDLYDLKLIVLAASHDIPILGICRGKQLINVAFGGTLYQDIPSQKNNTIKHLQNMPGEYGSHTITVVPGTMLASIIGSEKLAVNSFHHQAVKDVAPGFKVSAMAADGVIEAIEGFPDKPILGVEWHPEIQTFGGDTTMLKLFHFLVEQASAFRKEQQQKK